MEEFIMPSCKTLHTQNSDGSINTHPEGKSHSVVRQIRNPDGSWRMIFELSKDIPIGLPALEKGERYLIFNDEISEIVNY